MHMVNGQTYGQNTDTQKKKIKGGFKIRPQNNIPSTGHIQPVLAVA